jgi:hypothetical protein
MTDLMDGVDVSETTLNNITADEDTAVQDQVGTEFNSLVATMDGTT